MPAASITVQPDGTSTTVFQPSPRMSSYLVATVVAPMVHVSGMAGLANNVTVGVWAMNRSNNTMKIGYALDVGQRVLTFYEQLFQIPYPLPKADMAAIPDFAAGASESLQGDGDDDPARVGVQCLP